MKQKARQNAGITLVELLVVIATSSIVMLAAASLLLMGARVQKAEQEDAGEQQTVRIVLSVLEDLAGSGRIYRVETVTGGWQLKEKGDDGEEDNGPVLLQYQNGALTGGTSAENVLLDGLQNAQVDLNRNLLTFFFETKKHSYTTAVYCRSAITSNIDSEDAAIEKVEDGQVEITGAEKDARFAFLRTLAQQYRYGSTGQIIIDNGTYTYTDGYYSQWYIGDKYFGTADWNANTPWCACFLSWAADQNQAQLNDVPKFAWVNNGVTYFKNYKKGTEDAGKFWNERSSSYLPIPGDMIFFDWERDGDPDHAGAVLYHDNQQVYTIEGNSGGRVAVRCYRLDDPRIMGYGVLDWKTP